MSLQGGLPSGSSPTLVLANPTEHEQECIWTATHPQFGTALSQKDYLARERYLLTIPLARDGGITQWILTDSTAPRGSRPVLSSCETLRKRALVRGPDGVVREGWAHGVASVFTFTDLRGKGYAGRMIAMLADALKEMDKDALFSVLYSDIGKKFYTLRGWVPADSNHLEFSPEEHTVPADKALRALASEDLAGLAARDEALLRQQILGSPSKTRAVILPTLDQLQWHLYREDFMCDRLFSRRPAIRGALYTPPGAPPGSRVWAVWKRGFYSGTDTPQKNTLHVLRFVVEDDRLPDADLESAVGAIVGLARSEAAAWVCGRVDLWNPDDRVKTIVMRRPDLGAKFVIRETDSIASIKMLAGDSVEDVEWCANEKYAWC